jgi:hypothetical protein
VLDVRKLFNCVIESAKNDVLSVSLGLLSPSWLNLRTIGAVHHRTGMNDGMPPVPVAVLSHQSHIAVAVHCVLQDQCSNNGGSSGGGFGATGEPNKSGGYRDSGELEELYGVCASTIALGSNGSTVKCEGVTLFPPGPRWITLALGCIGVHGDMVRCRLNIIRCSTLVCYE